LSNSKLETLERDAFYRLDQLETIDLKNNTIGELPYGLFEQLESIEKIDLSYNNLSKIDFNQFLGNKKLQKIDLENNKIASITPVRLGSTISITKLCLNDNKLMSLSALDGVFSGLSQLETLKLTRNGLTELPDGVFKALMTVLEIDLSRNNLTSIDFNQFADNRKLQVLNLTDNSVGAIESSARGNDISIRILLLADNELVNVFELCSLQHLTTLDLSNNPNVNYGSLNLSCWSELSRLDMVNANLKSLNHDYHSFAGLNNLTHLNLDRNELDFFCVVNFPELPTLSLLSINDNKLQTLNVAKLKIKFGKLTTLKLANNHWNCEYFAGLVENLKQSNIELYPKKLQKNECHTNDSVLSEISENDGCKLIAETKKSNFLKFVTIFSFCFFVVSLIIDFLYKVL
jgi:leucine-rich repeats and immunoglobulin-like domains protein 1/3